MGAFKLPPISQSQACSKLAGSIPLANHARCLLPYTQWLRATTVGWWWQVGVDQCAWVMAKVKTMHFIGLTCWAASSSAAAVHLVRDEAGQHTGQFID